ncbi:MAG: AzlC family ABC transporter permease [SAR324 cluster bacterium]|nr:AzlC family ABC transporter permease [SAR324 cluster bacterium]
MKNYEHLKKKKFQGSDYYLGIKEGILTCFYFIFLFIAIGAAYKAEGLGRFVMTMGTVVVYSGPSQLGTMDLLASGSWISLLVTTVIVNARFMFLSAALLPHFREQKKITLAIAFQTMSATSFALTFARCQRYPSTHAFSYYLGVCSVAYPTAILGSYLGASAVGNIPQSYLTMFRMLLPIYFTHILAASWPQKKPVFAGLLGLILAPLIESIYPNAGLIAGATISGLVVLYTDQIIKKRST